MTSVEFSKFCLNESQFFLKYNISNEDSSNNDKEKKDFFKQKKKKFSNQSDSQWKE